MAYIISSQKIISNEIIYKAVESQNGLIVEKTKAQNDLLNAQQNYEHQRIYYQKFGEFNENLVQEILQLKKLRAQVEFNQNQNQELYLLRKKQIDRIINGDINVVRQIHI